MSDTEQGGTADPLLDDLRARIARSGPISVDAYMRTCLAHPRHGYWQRRDVIGAGGDFTTAPEISQIFGELIGLWGAFVWQSLGRPSPLRLVELGPGRGMLMRDALRAARVMPGFLEAASVHLVEISQPLREAQRETLAAGAPHVAVQWHEAVDLVPEGPAIVIANEFLDALPVRQLVFGDDGWHERVVGIDGQGALRFSAGVQAEAVGCEPSVPPPKPGDILELRAAEETLLATIAQRGGPTVALFIDYGPAEPAYGDTLQAVRRHAWVDPLAEPGRADLTAHVQFAELARKARAAGLAADGPMAQAEFLGRLGIAERAARLMAANPAEAGAIEAGVQRLLSPSGMGTLFKAMVVRSPGLSAMPPFV